MLQDLPQSLIDTTIGIITEKKDHLIRRLRNLTDEQKDEVIAFFKKKPNLENKIDWNRKDLTYDDFLAVMDISRIIAKRRVVRAKGIRGIKKGEDYIPLEAPEGVDAYILLNYEASRLIACDVGSGVGEWCTAQGKSYWDDYNSKNNVIIYILYSNTKEAIRFNRDRKSVEEIRDNENDEIPETEVHRIILQRNMREIMNADIHNIPDWVKKASTRNADYEMDGDDNDILIWKSGTWEHGIWEDGVWEGGTWEGGTWKNGVWQDGTWEDGTWEDGLWLGGIIYSHKFSRNVNSKVDPAEFYVIELGSNSVEELEDKVD